MEAAMDEVQEAHTGKANAIQEAHDASAAEREARRQAQIEHLAYNGELRARKINLGKSWQRWQAENATRAQVARMSHIAARVLAWGRRASSFAQWRHQWAMACTEIKQQEAASRNMRPRGEATGHWALPLEERSSIATILSDW